MTITNTTNKVRYSGNGTSTTFGVTFPFFAASDLQVYLIDTATGVETLQTQGTHYSVFGTNVVFVTPPPTGKDVLIVRIVPLTQEVDLQNTAVIDAEVLERALDRSAARDQQLNEAISRALLLPLGSTQGSITVPQPSAHKFMRWKADESGLENIDLSTVGALAVTDYAKTLLDDPDAATARNTLSAVGRVSGGTAGNLVSLTSGGDIADSGRAPGAANGVATLNASGTVVQRLSYEGVASGVATLNSGGLLVQQNPVLYVEDQKPSGTPGGSSTVGTQVRTLNTVVRNTISGASLSSNQITLPAGTYYVLASAPCHKSEVHKVFLYNATSGSVLLTGSSEYARVATEAQTRSFVGGFFTLSATSALELRHYVAVSASTIGLGVAVSLAGHNEVYSQVYIEKVA
jgi:hypothetical protein